MQTVALPLIAPADEDSPARARKLPAAEKREPLRRPVTQFSVPRDTRFPLDSGTELEVPTSGEQGRACVVEPRG